MLIDRTERRSPRKMPAIDKAPKLPMQVVPRFRVHYLDFEKFVQNIFGFEFDFKFASGLTEKSGAEYVVTGEMLTPSWVQKANELRQGRRSRSVALILAVLAHDNYVPKGYYTILT